MPLRRGQTFNVTLAATPLKELDQRIRVCPLRNVYSPIYVKENYGAHSYNYGRGYRNVPGPPVRRRPGDPITTTIRGGGLHWSMPFASYVNPQDNFDWELFYIGLQAGSAIYIERSDITFMTDLQGNRNTRPNYNAWPELNTYYEGWTPTLWDPTTALGRADSVKYGNKTGLFMMMPFNRVINVGTENKPQNPQDNPTRNPEKFPEFGINSPIPPAARALYSRLRDACKGKKAFLSGNNAPTNTGDLWVDEVFLQAGLIDPYGPYYTPNTKRGHLVNRLPMYLGVVFYFRNQASATGATIVDLTPPSGIDTYSMNSKYFSGQAVTTVTTTVGPGGTTRTGRAWVSAVRTGEAEANDFYLNSLNLLGADLTMDVLDSPGVGFTSGPATPKKYNIEITLSQLQAYQAPSNRRFHATRRLEPEPTADGYSIEEPPNRGYEFVSFRVLDASPDLTSADLDGDWTINGNKYRTWFIENNANDDVPNVIARREYLAR